MDWSPSNDDDIVLWGFTVLPHRISAAQVKQAMDLIEGDLSKQPPTVEEWQKCVEGTFCKKLVDGGSLNFLATDSGAFAFANQAIGCLEERLTAQVARRRRGDGVGPHIDGFYPDNEEPADTPEAVLGIYLTDVMKPEDGAFTVLPGDRSTVVEWAAKYPNGPKRSDKLPDFGDLGSGIPVLGRKGTAFLAHGALPHGQAKRTVNADFRDAVYFRLSRKKEHRNVGALLKSGGDKW